MTTVDDYYQIAREWENLSRQDLAREIRKLHDQTVDQVVEYAAEMVQVARELGESSEELEKNIRGIELKGRKFANDRMHLRRTEAILHVIRERKVLIVSKADVAKAYENGDGIEVGTALGNGTALEVELHKGKFEGK